MSAGKPILPPTPTFMSRLAVEETAIGKYEDKVQKNRAAALNTPGTEALQTEVKTGDHEICRNDAEGKIRRTVWREEAIFL